MPQTKNIDLPTVANFDGDLPTVANFDATLKAAGFRDAINGHYWLPYGWSTKETHAVMNWAGIAPYTLAYPMSRATAMQCLCLYVENFAG